MLVLAYLGLAGTALAAAATTTTLCSTISNSASTSKVRTYLQADVDTSVSTATVTKTSTPTSTFTPTSRTVTKNIVVTRTATEDAQQQTDTFYSTTTMTLTFTNVNTANFTTTTTSTTTVTAGGVTTTMPVGSKYTPLASQLAAQGYSVGYFANPGQVPNKRSNRLRDSGIELPAEQLEKRQDNITTVASSAYPAFVLCNKFIQQSTTSTATATASVSKTVTAARGTITNTYTSDVTITTTLTPSDASTTVDGGTVTTSSTLYTTTSTTTTSTVWTTSSIFNGATTTVWPQCQPTNFVDSVNGLGGYHYGYYNRPVQIASGVNSAQDCCNRAMAGGYAAGLWDHYYCVGMVTSTCDGTQPQMWFNTSNTYNYKPFVYFSTDCGTIKYRGRCDGCPNYE